MLFSLNFVHAKFAGVDPLAEQAKLAQDFVNLVKTEMMPQTLSGDAPPKG